MLNSIEAYKELGCKAAEAMNQHDQARYLHFKNHFMRCKGGEKEQDRIDASKAFDEGFAEARYIPKREYFR